MMDLIDKAFLRKLEKDWPGITAYWRKEGKAMVDEWRVYRFERDDIVSVEDWGKDHWSTFLYLETCAVDFKGAINNEYMRCNSDLHPEFHNAACNLMSRNYPTRLTHGRTRDGHDDWSCLEDLMSAGLVQAWTYKYRTKNIGGGKVKVALTDKGWQVVGELRAYKAANGNYADFVADIPVKEKTYYRHYKGNTKIDFYRSMNTTNYPHDVFSLCVPMDELVRKVVKLNYGVHRFLSSLVHARRELVHPKDELAQRIEDLLNAGYW